MSTIAFNFLAYFPTSSLTLFKKSLTSSLILFFYFASTSYSIELVRWNGTTCVPNVCHGAQIDSIKPMLSEIPIEIIQSQYLFDQIRTLKCFSNKYITVLGDSSTAETIVDLYHLLAGAYSNRRNENSTVHEEKLIKHAGHISTTLFKISPQDPEVIVYLHGDSEGRESARNCTVVIAEWNITIRYRWGGHHQIGGNNGGLKSLLTEGGLDMQKELDCLFGKSSDLFPHCPVPDIFVVQSGAHETGRSNESYVLYLQIMFKKMRELADSSKQHTRIFFKGTSAPHFNEAFAAAEAGGPGPHNWILQAQLLNEIAEMEAKIFNIRFIDSTAEAHRLKKLVDLSRFYRSWPHVGYNGHASELFFSTYLTQHFIREICM
jgi:hypothetical protein